MSKRPTTLVAVLVLVGAMVVTMAAGPWRRPAPAVPPKSPLPGVAAPPMRPLDPAPAPTPEAELPPELRPGAAAWAAMEAPVSEDEILAELLSDDRRYPVHDGFAHALAERQVRLRRARAAVDAAHRAPDGANAPD